MHTQLVLDETQSCETSFITAVVRTQSDPGCACHLCTLVAAKRLKEQNIFLALNCRQRKTKDAPAGIILSGCLFPVLQLWQETILFP